MKYRVLGKSGEEVSILGFGCMRLPIKGGAESAADIFNPEKLVDEEEGTRMIEYAVEHGVNYFDTAYGYHGGQSETFLGKAIRPHRDQVFLASKLPVWMVQAESDLDRILNEQLARLDTDRLDFYLLHGLARHSWEPILKMGVLEFLNRIRADGRVRQVGFSFHDDVKTFKEIVDSYDWEICQIQYNYYDENYQAGREGLEYAAGKGIGIVAMEPLRGGQIVDRIPEEVQKVWDTAPQRRSPVEWAFRWVWDQTEVSMALSGMSTMAQVMENIDIAGEIEPGSLTEDEKEIIKTARSLYRRMMKVDCTSCAYCMPCPSGVNIPGNFSLYNDMFMFKDPELNVMLYNHTLPPEQRASSCTECGQCEEQCPQQILIIDALKTVDRNLGQNPRQA
jgi:predicted aldo/keto reductase-like oxidoreductase